MQDYRVLIRLLSPLGTPWQSDTVFGHLAWQVARGRGGIDLGEFLSPFREGRPSFVLSDGFPGDLLPRPLVPVPTSPTLSIEEYAATKLREKSLFVSLDDFRSLRTGERTEWEPVFDAWMRVKVAHAALDRITDTTGGGAEGEGGNFFETELLALSHGDTMSIYLRAEDDWAQWVAQSLEDMAPLGFGRDRSTGSGAYQVIGLETWTEFAALDGANGFISMSSYCPARSDPIAGRWRIRLKHGRLGENAGAGNPFKRPLLQFEPGAVFLTKEAPRLFYGRVVPEVAPGMPEAIQCCYTLAVPCVLDEQTLQEGQP